MEMEPVVNIKIAEKNFEPTRIFCIGRNYALHAAELDNDVPATPIVFSKPVTALLEQGEPIRIPEFCHDFHHEVELVVLIGKSCKPTCEAEALDAIAGIGIGLDLTLRDLQREIMADGAPWEKSKGFDGSAPVAGFVPFTKETDLSKLEISCKVDGEIRQQGCTGDMIFSVPELLIDIAKYWQLLPGDLLFTGTPVGVGPLKSGQTIEISGSFTGSYKWDIV